MATLEILNCCFKIRMEGVNKGGIRGATNDSDRATRTISTTCHLFFPFGHSTEPLVLHFLDFSSPSDRSAMSVPCALQVRVHLHLQKFVSTGGNVT
jgi:hypothetical protein